MDISICSRERNLWLAPLRAFVRELATFYEQIIGKPADMVEHEQGFYGWQVGSAFLGILEHSEMGGAAKDPGRITLNYASGD